MTAAEASASALASAAPDAKTDVEAPDDEPIALDEGPPRRRWVLVAGGLVAVLVVGGGALVVGRTLASDPYAGETPTEPATALDEAAVELRTLTEHAELDGTLGYGEAIGLAYPGEGTLTYLPALGAVIRRGETLLEVDGVPVPLLYGARPLWRELGPDAEDGPDIGQLEANLVALGIATDDVLTVDQDWTSVTTRVVKEWQALRGVEASGVVAPSDVVFEPDAVRVAEVGAVVGGSAAAGGVDGTGSLMKVASTDQMVTVGLEASRQTLLSPDQKVGVLLPDGTEVAGVVTSVGRVAIQDDSAEEDQEDNNATIEVVIALDDPDATGPLDQAPVTVRVETDAADDVLAVPIEALLALADGRYAVEVRQADRLTKQVPVELGVEADGWVQVAGDVVEGDKVVVPLD